VTRWLTVDAAARLSLGQAAVQLEGTQQLCVLHHFSLSSLAHNVVLRLPP
jgi:hypothetical protein